MANKPKTGTKKKAGRKPETRKVTVEVPASVVRTLDKQLRGLRRRMSDVSRSDLIRLALRRYVGPSLPKRDRRALYEELLRRSGVLKLNAKAHLADGRPHRARPLYLRAAALELEALVLLEDPGEDTLKSALLEILFLLKSGAGYSRLPDVPGERRTVRSVQ